MPARSLSPSLFSLCTAVRMYVCGSNFILCCTRFPDSTRRCMVFAVVVVVAVVVVAVVAAAIACVLLFSVHRKIGCSGRAATTSAVYYCRAATECLLLCVDWSSNVSYFSVRSFYARLFLSLYALSRSRSVLHSALLICYLHAHTEPTQLAGRKRRRMV